MTDNLDVDYGPSASKRSMGDLRIPIEPGASLRKGALISPCRAYRYWLTRQWKWGHSAVGSWLLPIIMLNPSTADADNDDPTIRRCIAFARREGFDGIKVMNLFAFRATSPDDMKASADPVGPDNDDHLKAMLSIAVELRVPVLAAWGAHGGHVGRADAVRQMAKKIGASLVCLGTTSAGHPRHPLYVKGDQPLQSFAADTPETQP